MSWTLPPSIASHPLANRALAGLQATVGAGVALLALRGTESQAREVGNQLKTAVDRAAEGWVLGLLEARYPKDLFLAEERYSDAPSSWKAPGTYWTVDALDGTRSFVEGYPGYCVQVSYVGESGPVLGVVFEPAADTVYLAAQGAGAWRRSRGSAWSRLRISDPEQWPSKPRFIDSTMPRGIVGDLLALRRGCFVECGSIGLKICRVADGTVDLFMKELAFKLWDVAPGEAVLREAGGLVGTMHGQRIDYTSGQIVWQDILAAPPTLYGEAVNTTRRV